MCPSSKRPRTRGRLRQSSTCQHGEPSTRMSSLWLRVQEPEGLRSTLQFPAQHRPSLSFPMSLRQTRPAQGQLHPPYREVPATDDKLLPLRLRCNHTRPLHSPPACRRLETRSILWMKHSCGHFNEIHAFFYGEFHDLLHDIRFCFKCDFFFFSPFVFFFYHHLDP